MISSQWAAIRARVVAEALIGAASELSAESLSVLADLGGAIVALGRVLDDSSFDEEAIRTRLLDWAACATEPNRAGADPVGERLASVRVRLVAAPLARELYGTWTERVFDLASCAVDERRPAGGGARTFADQLDLARRTGGLPVLTAAAWLLLGERGVLDEIARISLAEIHLSRAFRLAQDYASYVRGADNPRNLFVLAGSDATHELLAVARAELTRGDQQLARTTAAPRSVAFLRRFTRGAVSRFER